MRSGKPADMTHVWSVRERLPQGRCAAHVCAPPIVNRYLSFNPKMFPFCERCTGLASCQPQLVIGLFFPKVGKNQGTPKGVCVCVFLMGICASCVTLGAGRFASPPHTQAREQQGTKPDSPKTVVFGIDTAQLSRSNPPPPPRACDAAHLRNPFLLSAVRPTAHSLLAGGLS